MDAKLLSYKRKLLLMLSAILISGFLTLSLVSYYSSVAGLRENIVHANLPLTSGSVYAQIQQEFLRPIFISSVMAQDTFLRDWLVEGEGEKAKISRYLGEIKKRYGMFASFLVSEKSRNYYYDGGILKTVSADEPRDRWYFRVRQMSDEYEINIDPDMANSDRLTAFINYRIHDDDGRYLGAIGVGLTTDAVIATIKSHVGDTVGDIYFVDSAGSIVLRSARHNSSANSLRDLGGFADATDTILGSKSIALEIERNGETVHVNSRFIPELKWHLVVEQAEAPLKTKAQKTLILNLLFCFAITAIVIMLTYIGAQAYQKRITAAFDKEQELRAETQSQKEEIDKQHSELKRSLSEVKALSNLLPICSVCKKVRDDQGYWRLVEAYIEDNTGAQCSHGICPECINKQYPKYAPPPNKTDKK